MVGEVLEVGALPDLQSALVLTRIALRAVLTVDRLLHAEAAGFEPTQAGTKNRTATNYHTSRGGGTLPSWSRQGSRANRESRWVHHLPLTEAGNRWCVPQEGLEPSNCRLRRSVPYPLGYCGELGHRLFPGSVSSSLSRQLAFAFGRA